MDDGAENSPRTDRSSFVALRLGLAGGPDELNELGAQAAGIFASRTLSQVSDLRPAKAGIDPGIGLQQLTEGGDGQRPAGRLGRSLERRIDVTRADRAFHQLRGRL